MSPCNPTSACARGLPEKAGLSRLSSTVTGYHGAPSQMLSDLRATFRRHRTIVAHAFAGMLAVLQPSSIRRLDQARAIGASFQLAGFAMLCDWIGSTGWRISRTAKRARDEPVRPQFLRPFLRPALLAILAPRSKCMV